MIVNQFQVLQCTLFSPESNWSPPPLRNIIGPSVHFLNAALHWFVYPTPIVLRNAVRRVANFPPKVFQRACMMRGVQFNVSITKGWVDVSFPESVT